MYICTICCYGALMVDATDHFGLLNPLSWPMIIQYESKKRFQKRKLSFNAFAVFSSRSVSFPSINRSVSFRSVLSRSISYYVSG